MERDHLVILVLLVLAALVTLGYVYVLFHKVSKIKVENLVVNEAIIFKKVVK